MIENIYEPNYLIKNVWSLPDICLRRLGKHGTFVGTCITSPNDGLRRGLHQLRELALDAIQVSGRRGTLPSQ